MTKTVNISAFKIDLNTGQETQLERDFTRDEVLRITGISSSTLNRRESRLRAIPVPEFQKERYGHTYTLMDLWILIYMRDYLNDLAYQHNPESPNWVYAIAVFTESMSKHGIPLNLYQQFKAKIQTGEIEL